MTRLGSALLTLLLCAAPLGAELLSESKLEVHASILPKTLMMDYAVDDKLVDGVIVIGVFYDTPEQRSTAGAFSRQIEQKYPDGISGYPIRVLFLSYEGAFDPRECTLCYLLPASESTIRNQLQKLHGSGKLSFAYRHEDLREGAMVSLLISHKVRPILNVDALRDENITLRPILLKIAEIYYSGTSLNGYDGHD